MAGGYRGPPIPASAAAPLPDSRYTQEPLPRVRATAAWRPAAVEHVLNLDGQRCSIVDLTVRCTSPPHAAAALAVDAATSATDPASTDVDSCADAVRRIHRAMEMLDRNPNEKLLVESLLWSLPDAQGVTPAPRSA